MLNRAGKGDNTLQPIFLPVATHFFVPLWRKWYAVPLPTSCPTFLPKNIVVRFHHHHVTVPIGLAVVAKRQSQLLIKQNEGFLP